MLIHSVHTKVCGCTQTEVEPSIYVRIVVDGNDRVTGYLVAAAFVDDLRFFGTGPEIKKYMEDGVKVCPVQYLGLCETSGYSGNWGEEDHLQIITNVLDDMY